MGILAPLGRRLAKLSIVKTAIDERANLDAFKQAPSWRIVVGVGLIAMSFVVGWPGVIGSGWLAIHLRDPLYLLLGGPLCYGLSWVVWGLGMAIAGPDNLRYARILLRWGLRKLALALDGAPTDDSDPKGSLAGPDDS